MVTIVFTGCFNALRKCIHDAPYGKDTIQLTASSKFQVD